MILVLGGTGDGLELAVKLYALTDRIVLSTTTDYGEKLAQQAFKGQIVHGQMDYEALKDFCKAQDIEHIVDATHPYAQIITENAIKVSHELEIPYYRYERPYSLAAQQAEASSQSIIYCKDYTAAGKIIEAGTGNVLVTTGSRHIEDIIKEVKDIKRIYARILPKSEHLLKLEALNILPDQIIAMKGPFSLEMNKLMMTQIQARYLITKESGTQGNTDEKIQAALDMNVQILVINRPEIDYPIVCVQLDEMISMIRNKLFENL